MNIKALLIDFTKTFVVALLVSGIVTFLWNLIVHGTSTVDWETSFRFAIIFGVLLTWMESRRNKQEGQL